MSISQLETVIKLNCPSLTRGFAAAHGGKPLAYR